MLAAVLILAGVVLVVLGVVTSSTTLTAVALGLGVVAVVVLLLPLGRATPRGAPTSKPARTAAKAGASAKKPGASAKKPAASAKKSASSAVATPAAPGTEATVVLVVAGRHRFHQPGCELLEGKEPERLSPEEAQEEGFTACSRCVGARASI